MRSSYSTNNFSDVFRAVVSAFQSKTCVELGVLEGYSTVAIAEELRVNAEKNCGLGHLDAYDLFDQYPFNHASKDIVQENLQIRGLEDYVTLFEQDAFLAHEKYENGTVHFLHVDLSNTGETVREIMRLWDTKLQIGGIIAFEGGSEQRDQVPWMIQYKKEPIKKELETNPIIEKNYVFATYYKFPSLTMLLKKR